jgi:putative membrane protein
MAEPAVPHGTTSTPPPPSANGSAPALPAAAHATGHGRLRTRISGMRSALTGGAAVLVVVMISVMQNARAVDISFLGAHLPLSRAVALLFAVIAGALVLAAGTAWSTQLRRIMRRDRRNRHAG